MTLLPTGIVPPQYLGIVFAVGAAVLISLLTVSVRLGTNEGTAMETLFIVLLTNIAILVPLALILEYPTYTLTLRAILAFAGAGLVGTLIGRSLTYTSVERIGASRTEPIKSSQPLHATLIAILVLGEYVSPIHMSGILLIVLGIAVVSWEATRGGSADIPTVKPVELLIPLGGAFFYGIEPTLAKLGFQDGTSVFVALSVKSFAAFSGYLAYMRIRGTIPRISTFEQSNLRWYIVAGVLNTGFLIVYYLALQLAPVSVVLPIVTTSPLLVVLFSWLFLPQLEHITWRLSAAASIVVAGAAIITAYG